MTRPTRLAVAVLAAASVTLPAATAQAAPARKAVSVGHHVKKAQGAQARVATLAKRGDLRSARRVLRTARHEAVVAARQARQAAANAGTSDRAARDAIWSLTSAAGNYGTAIEQYAGLLPDVSTSFQQLLAAAIPGSIAGREQLIQSLTDLMTQLSGTAQELAAKALAALQVQTPQQVEALTQTAAEDDLPTQIQNIITSAITSATEVLKSGIAQLGQLVPNLPENVQTPVAGALTSISSFLEGILPQVTSIVSSVSGIVKQVISMVEGFLPHFGPVAGDDDTPSSSGGGLFGRGGLFGGLLQGITNLVPGFGGMFGGLFA